MRALLLTLLLASFSLPAVSAGELSGRHAPGFSLPDLNLKQHDLADYRGRIVLLDIMQTACPHCQTFSSVLEDVRLKFRDEVSVLTIVLPPDTQATVREFAKKRFLSTPFLFDCGQVAASYLKVTPQNPRVEVPHLFIIDANGVIRNDYAYNDANKAIFEGKALHAEIERMVSTPSASKKR